MNLLLKLNCYALGVCAAAALGANTEPVPQAQPQGERPAIRIPIDGLGEQLEQATDAVDQATKALEGITGAVEEPAADGLEAPSPATASKLPQRANKPVNQSERAEPARNAGQDTNGALSGIEQAGEKLGKALEQVAPQIDNAGQEINRALRALERLGPIDAQTKLEVEQAIEGDIHAAVTTAVAGYKVQTSAMWIALATFALAALLLAPMMVTRKRAAETRAALAHAEAEQARLQQAMTEARLAAMQAQIEPHFLFNTMASVQHLIETDPGRAAHLQQNLTQYLRAAIPQLRESTTVLGREVELARAYLSVLKARMEERLEFRIDVPTMLASAPFPPMMLLTLVENAIKHGLEPKSEGGAVRISAAREGEAMQVTVADTGAGFEPKPGFGTGLTNIRERLRLLYGDKASLILEPNEPAGTRATIALPYS